MPTVTPTTIAITTASQGFITVTPNCSAASKVSSAAPLAMLIVGVRTPPGAPAPIDAVVPTSLPTQSASPVVDRHAERHVAQRLHAVPGGEREGGDGGPGDDGERSHDRPPRHTEAIGDRERLDTHAQFEEEAGGEHRGHERQQTEDQHPRPRPLDRREDLVSVEEPIDAAWPPAAPVTENTSARRERCTPRCSSTYSTPAIGAW